jgi:nucleotide-binding universal stress UspA family protein
MASPILVGFDPKTADRGPVRFGAVAARFTGAPLIVGSVYADSAVIGQMAHGQMEDELVGDADRALRRVRSELAREAVEAECRPLPGHSAPGTLHRAAEEFGAGLLVVGSSDRGAAGRVLPGSTADRLMHGAPCPIAVVPHDWRRTRPLEVLGIAYADTPEGKEALESGLALARRARARVRVLMAIKPRHFGRAAGGRPGAETTTYDAAGEEMENAQLRIVSEAERRAPDVAVEPDVSVQDAAEFLIAASAGVDMLICGSRGYGPQRAVLLGGVSRKVASGAQCPVIVLARGVADGLRPLIADRAEVGA